MRSRDEPSPFTNTNHVGKSLRRPSRPDANLTHHYCWRVLRYWTGSPHRQHRQENRLFVAARVLVPPLNLFWLAAMAPVKFCTPGHSYVSPVKTWSLLFSGTVTPVGAYM